MIHILLVLSLSLIPFTNAAATVISRNSNKGFSLPLIRANQGRTTQAEKAAWARTLGEILIAKYGASTSKSITPESPLSKRASSGTNDLVNHNQDSSYFGSLAVGTPPLAFNVILDTGSSDMWIASSTCRTGCNGIPTFSPSASSTFKNLSQSFNIQYGSGAAQGSLGEDTVQMAGFSVPSQKFGIVSAVSQGLLQKPVSGLLGLAFQAISSSGAMPFWQTLVEGGVWSQPVMSFYLTRFINATHIGSQEPGGRFTMGYTDPSLHEGDIEFTPIPSGQQGYWLLPLTSLTVNGQNVTVPTTTNSAAIDTGTTLIGGPPDVIAQLFAQIPGSSPATGDYEGYYTYPCSTAVNIGLSFGGRMWPINPDDFLLTQLTPDECLGAMFSLNVNTGPGWIIGDTFLKNVYSVFQYSPAAVGFAPLSVAALDLAVPGGPLPSQTIGANPTEASSRSAAFRTAYMSRSSHVLRLLLHLLAATLLGLL